ncbi:MULTISPECIES: acyltransferase family protein [Actinomadura]|uniref:Acyltransferase family protein n=1 Tax=Actinomadura yumaensis TaxID=111807 RepID=A0ABW2CPV4_9ACTN|nr:acyltransferase [Actinomadura sp. J1-007]MWK40464.1 acyltransferase family protein [Actinomadura sp. J1-007]
MTAADGSRAHPPEGAPARSGRVRELEGYRGVAALSTVVFHVWQHYTTYGPEGARPPLANGFARAFFSFEVVDLFFVLSAYLLTLSYARAAIDREPGHPARTFLFRRAVRILPLYWTAILVVWTARNPGLPGDWRDLAEHLTFTQVFDGERIFYTIGASWSMSLEIMFYGALVVLGPLAARACRPFARRGARVAVCASGCALLFAGPVAWLAVAHYGLRVPVTDWPAYYGPHARFHAFAAGMLLAVVTVALGERGRLGARASALARAAAVGALLALAWLSKDHAGAASVFYHPLAALLWTVLIHTTVQVRRGGLWHRCLRARWLTGVGLVSYSLYLWHEPIMIWLDGAGALPGGPGGFGPALLVVLAVALPAAAASYWAIEYPAALLRRLRDSSHRRRDYYPELSP